MKRVTKSNKRIAKGMLYLTAASVGVLLYRLIVKKSNVKQCKINKDYFTIVFKDGTTERYKKGKPVSGTYQWREG